MANKDLKIIQENTNGDFVIVNFTPQANKVLGFEANGNPENKTLGLLSFTAQTNLTIDGANYDVYECTVSTNSSFTLSNIVIGKQYFIPIKNSGASEITITLPNTADTFPAATFKIAAGKTKEANMIYNGTKRIWQISEELT